MKPKGKRKYFGGLLLLLIVALGVYVGKEELSLLLQQGILFAREGAREILTGEEGPTLEKSPAPVDGGEEKKEEDVIEPLLSPREEQDNPLEKSLAIALGSPGEMVAVASWETPMTVKRGKVVEEEALTAEAVAYLEKLSDTFRELRRSHVGYANIQKYQSRYTIEYSGFASWGTATTTVFFQLTPSMTAADLALVENYSRELREEVAARGELSTPEKIRHVHDAILRKASYAVEEVKTGERTASGHSVYDPVAIVADGKGVCDAYAKLVMKVLSDMDIPVLYVVGKAYPDTLSGNGETGEDNGHAWNLVEVEGAWYHLDLTWDDPVYPGNIIQTISYDYFLKGDDTMAEKGRREWDREVYPEAPKDYK